MFPRLCARLSGGGLCDMINELVAAPVPDATARPTPPGSLCLGLGLASLPKGKVPEVGIFLNIFVTT